MTSLGDIFVRFGADVSELQRAYGQIRRETRDLGQMLGDVGGMLTKAVTLPVLAMGAAVTGVGVRFGTAFSQIEGLVGVTGDALDELREGVLELSGPATTRSPVELSEALFFITSAGLRGQEALDALEFSAKAAAAGLGQTTGVADAVTSAINSYGAANLTAAQATDVLTATVREGKAAAADIAPQLGRLLPLAAELGVSFDQVGAAIAVFSKGTGSAELSATQLTGILSKLLGPTEMGAKALAALGLSSQGLRDSIQQNGLLETLVDLREKIDASGGNAGETFKAIFEEINAVNGVLQLTGDNADSARAVFDSLASSAGATDTAFAAASNTLGAKWGSALSQAQTLALAFAPTVEGLLIPALDAVTRAMGSLTEFVRGLAPEMKTAIVVVAGLAATLGPLLLVAGKVVTALPAISVALGGLKTALGVAAVATGPFLAGFAAVAALAAIIITNWEPLREFFQREFPGALDPLKEGFASAVATIRATMTQISAQARVILGDLGTLWRTHGETITTVVRAAFGLVARVIGTQMAIVGDLVSAVLRLLTGDFSGAMEAIGRAVTRGLSLVIRSTGEGLSALLSLYVKFATRVAGPLGAAISAPYRIAAGEILRLTALAADALDDAVALSAYTDALRATRPDFLLSGSGGASFRPSPAAPTVTVPDLDLAATAGGVGAIAAAVGATATAAETLTDRLREVQTTLRATLAGIETQVRDGVLEAFGAARERVRAFETAYGSALDANAGRATDASRTILRDLVTARSAFQALGGEAGAALAERLAALEASIQAGLIRPLDAARERAAALQTAFDAAFEEAGRPQSLTAELLRMGEAARLAGLAARRLAGEYRTALGLSGPASLVGAQVKAQENVASLFEDIAPLRREMGALEALGVSVFERIGDAARRLADVVGGAVADAVFVLGRALSYSGSAEFALDVLDAEAAIARLNEQFAEGSISGERYRLEMEVARDRLAEIESLGRPIVAAVRGIGRAFKAAMADVVASIVAALAKAALLSLAFRALGIGGTGTSFGSIFTGALGGGAKAGPLQVSFGQPAMNEARGVIEMPWTAVTGAQAYGASRATRLGASGY